MRHRHHRRGSGDDGDALNWFAARSDLLASDAGKDVAENGVKAYDNGVYTKALEFVDFHRRLNASHALKNAAVVKWRAALREAVVGDAAAGAKPELVFNVTRAWTPCPTRCFERFSTSRAVVSRYSTTAASTASVSLSVAVSSDGCATPLATSADTASYHLVSRSPSIRLETAWERAAGKGRVALGSSPVTARLTVNSSAS